MTTIELNTIYKPKDKLRWSAMLTISALMKLLTKGKSICFEFKEATASTPRYITELYSAFANTYGGVLVLGVKEDPKKKFKREILNCWR